MASAAQPIKIAILAMGGEGGGVLADWIVDLGEHNGHLAQVTSVPGVAQRTGATLYYVELFPEDAAQQAGVPPVLALMPLPGDVDVVLASELMEAGRAVQRGLVTPERTTLLASTHRVYAIAEKTAMGDGRSDSAALLAHAQGAARRFIGWDMAASATQAGSVISAVLFGALAGSGALPFSRAQFEATVSRGGVGVGPSLKAFGEAFDRAAGGPGPAVDAAAPSAAAAAPAAPPAVPRSVHPEVQALLDQARAAFDGDTLGTVVDGLRRVVDYQDPAYAALYLQRLAGVQAAAGAMHARSSPLLHETARHLALWMSYEDTIRVADLKTRGSRLDRVRGEVGVLPGQLLQVSEYLHPRLDEIAETLPAGLGRWLLASGAPRRWVEAAASKGRVVTTTSLRGHLMLTVVAGLRRWRRGTLRFAIEQPRIEGWLADIGHAAATDLALATEIARCQRLVKGYGDTHERGWRHFELLRQCWQHGTAATTLAVLRDAALADEHGRALQAALQRLAPHVASHSAPGHATGHAPPSTPHP
ncbi:indolepyruvate oxidoreductase subunit beta family protein [Ideonella sp. A 288]|uniref:indolepyruvate oxidoreductase subunit beta family protein n=1 Tax=Ideonella sp. A 288 TaxID=1962181 RepID=UPI000B4C05D1|nr:indolepyruvate oxidoreductase subunit beta family protein [Ideonella sp. A 288]